MKPLVIGGTGFIGYNLVKGLTEKGYPVRCIRRKSSNTILLRKLKPEMIYGDIEDINSLRNAMQGCDTVFMAAAHYPRYSVGLKKQVKYATQTIRNVLQAARENNIKRFIYTSSITTVLYLNSNNRLATEDDGIGQPPGRSVYFAVKHAMETEVLKAIEEGLSGTILCVAGCFGEADMKMGTASLLVNTINQTQPYWIDGKINIVDVADVVEVHIKAALADKISPRYIVGNHNIMIRDLLDIIVKRYNVPKLGKELPLFIGYYYTILKEYLSYFQKKRTSIPLEFVDMLRFSQYFDCTKVKKELYNISTPLEVTLDKTYNWFRKYKYINNI